jgi:hypothetical protein
MSKLINAFVMYKFVKLLVTPFNKTEAYKLGIIDEKGKYLKKQKDLVNTQEKMASNIFTRLVWNIKKLIEKVPFGKSTLGSLTAALFLLKEETRKMGIDDIYVDEVFQEYMLKEHNIDYKKEMLNEKFKGVSNGRI